MTVGPAAWVRRSVINPLSASTTLPEMEDHRRPWPSRSPRRSPKEAYIYGEPMVGNYRVQHACFVDRSEPGIQKRPGTRILEQRASVALSPADTAIQTPQPGHTLYSMLGTGPAFGAAWRSLCRQWKDRYFSVRLIELLHLRFPTTAGTRTTGNGGQVDSFARRAALERRGPQRGVDKVFQLSGDRTVAFPA